MNEKNNEENKDYESLDNSLNQDNANGNYKRKEFKCIEPVDFEIPSRPKETFTLTQKFTEKPTYPITPDIENILETGLKVVLEDDKIDSITKEQYKNLVEDYKNLEQEEKVAYLNTQGKKLFPIFLKGINFDSSNENSDYENIETTISDIETEKKGFFSKVGNVFGNFREKITDFFSENTQELLHFYAQEFSHFKDLYIIAKKDGLKEALKYDKKIFCKRFRNAKHEIKDKLGLLPTKKTRKIKE